MFKEQLEAAFEEVEMILYDTKIRCLFDDKEYLSWFCKYFDNFNNQNQCEIKKTITMYFLSDEKHFYMLKERFNRSGFHFINPEDNSFKGVIDKQKSLHLCYIPKITRESKYHSIRYLRKHLSKILTTKTHLCIHAAAVSKNDKIITIVGDKRAGKTTSMLNLLNYGGFDFLTNDKIYIESESMRPLVLPFSIGIRKETLNKDQNLNKKVVENYSSYSHYQISVNEVMYKDNILSHIDKVFILPDELCNTFSIAQKTSGELSLFLLPSYDSEVENLIIQLVEGKDKEKYIENNILYGWLNKQSITKLLEIKFYKLTYNERLVNEFIQAINGLIKNV